MRSLSGVRPGVVALALALAVVATPVSAALDPRSAQAAVRTSTAVAPAPVPLPPGAAMLTVDRATGDALGRRVSTALSAAGATTIAAAVDVSGYEAVLRRDANHALPPASTQKTVTGLSVLLALGPTARLETRVQADRLPVLGRLRGNLWLVAGGDPYLTTTDLRGLARRVREAGITSVAGDLLLDDTRYDARRTASGWKSSFLPGQSGPLSALAVDRNAYRSDAAFLADPALPGAVRFRDALRAEGVGIRGLVRRQALPPRTRTVASHRSAPMSQVVARALKRSDNFATELLTKELGRVVRGEGTSAAGVLATRQVMGPYGVVPGAAADGSGLSSVDRQSPAGQVRLLRAADRSASGPAFRAALPIGCRDGTLVRRFCGTAAEARVSAKTGTLSGVRALAGYTRTASGRDVWFAFQLTGVSDPARALAAMDRAVVVLAGATE